MIGRSVQIERCARLRQKSQQKLNKWFPNHTTSINYALLEVQRKKLRE